VPKTVCAAWAIASGEMNKSWLTAIFNKSIFNISRFPNDKALAK
jgi:hypothetical protein